MPRVTINLDNLDQILVVKERTLAARNFWNTIQDIEQRHREAMYSVLLDMKPEERKKFQELCNHDGDTYEDKNSLSSLHITRCATCSMKLSTRDSSD